MGSRTELADTPQGQVHEVRVVPDSKKAPGRQPVVSPVHTDALIPSIATVAETAPVTATPREELIPHVPTDPADEPAGMQEEAAKPISGYSPAKLAERTTTHAREWVLSQRAAARQQSDGERAGKRHDPATQDHVTGGAQPDAARNGRDEHTGRVVTLPDTRVAEDQDLRRGDRDVTLFVSSAQTSPNQRPNDAGRLTTAPVATLEHTQDAESPADGQVTIIQDQGAAQPQAGGGGRRGGEDTGKPPTGGGRPGGGEPGEPGLPEGQDDDAPKPVRTRKLQLIHNAVAAQPDGANLLRIAELYFRQLEGVSREKRGEIPRPPELDAPILNARDSELGDTPLAAMRALVHERPLVSVSKLAARFPQIPPAERRDVLAHITTMEAFGAVMIDETEATNALSRWVERQKAQNGDSDASILLREKISTSVAIRPLWTEDKSRGKVQEQIADRLREILPSLPAGTRLPKESELQELFGTESIYPIRHALTILRDEGRIVGKQGKGIFIVDENEVQEEQTKPEYIRVADAIAAEIGVGKQFPPEGPLPTEDALQTLFGVKRNTVRLSLAVLRQRNLVITIQGKGSFVPKELDVQAEDGPIEQPLPIYKMHANSMEALIRAGEEFAPGARFYTVPEVGETLGVDISMAKRVVQELRERGLVESRQGDGTYVRKVLLAEGERMVVEQPVAAYKMHANSMEALIRAGEEFTPGGRFYTQRELEEKLDIKPPMAHKVIQELRERGLIISRPGDGSYVREKLPREGARVVVKKQTPKYVLFADDLEIRIRSGGDTLTPGSTFPGQRELMRMYNTSPDMANRILIDMIQRGIAVNKPDVGFVIIDTLPDVTQVPRKKPLYELYANALDTKIRSHELLAGSKLPSKQQIMDDYDISAETAMRVLRELRERGLAEKGKGLGLFVTRDIPDEDLRFPLEENEPLYKIYTDIYTEKIRTRELPAGSKLPTERELIEQHDVSRSTAKRILRELRGKGLAVKGKGIGLYTPQKLPQEGTRVPIADEKLYKKHAADLEKKIRSGEIARGAQLPSEAELAEELGVSRNTVRGMIAELRAKGLVESIQGSGTFVRQTFEAPGTRIVEEKPTPAYRRLAENLRARIETGEFGPGDMLPTEQELIDDSHARNTVRAAIALLRQWGLVVTKPGVGSLVRRTDEDLQQESDEK